MGNARCEKLTGNNVNGESKRNEPRQGHCIGAVTSRREHMKSVRLLAVAFVVPTLTLVVSQASAQNAGDDDAKVHRDPALPQVAPGSPAGVFGAKTQLTISSDAGFSISNTSVSGVDGSTTKVELRPAIDYFVMDNFSVGGFVGFDYSSDPGGHTTTFSVLCPCLSAHGCGAVTGTTVASQLAPPGGCGSTHDQQNSQRTLTCASSVSEFQRWRTPHGFGLLGGRRAVWL